MARKLQVKEIVNILDSIFNDDNIPLASKIKKAKNKILRNQFKNQLKNISIYPEIIPKLCAELKKSYEKTKIPTGECVGVIMAQSIGENSTQQTLNSVEYNENLIIDTCFDQGSCIGETIDTLLKQNENHIQWNDDVAYLPIPKGYASALTIADDGSVDWKPLEAVTRHPPINKDGSPTLVKVKTGSGREITCTKAKSFLVYNGTTFQPKEGCNLEIGDLLPLIKTFYGRQTSLSIKNILSPKCYIFTSIMRKGKIRFESGIRPWFSSLKHTVPYRRSDTMRHAIKSASFLCQGERVYLLHYNCFGKRAASLPETILLDRSFGFFIGSYLAEGCLTEYQVHISNNNTTYRNLAAEWCEKQNIGHHSSKQEKNGGISTSIMFHSKILVHFLLKTCGRGSWHKYVPSFAYSAPDDFVKGLLDAYISGDGSVAPNGSITTSSRSKRLNDGMGTLLSRFGVYATHGQTVILEKPHFSLYVPLREARRLSQHVTLSIDYKQQRIESIHIKQRRKRKCDVVKDVLLDRVVTISEVISPHPYVYDLTVADTRNMVSTNGLACRDTFHSAGIAIGTVVTGIPKLCELLNTTHNPKSLMCQVFCIKNKSIKSMRNHIKYSLVELTLGKLKTKIEIHNTIPNKSWYKIFKCIYPEKFVLYPCCISFHLDKKSLVTYALPLHLIAEKINKEYSDVNAIFSPLHEAIIDIFVDITNIAIPDDNLQINEDNKIDIYLRDIVIKKLQQIVLYGIPGIKNMFFQKQKKKWMIITEGSNLIQLLRSPIFDQTRTISNDMWEIYEIFGIEATREFLIEEFIKIITEDGTFINNCHIYLLVDIMTFKGLLLPVSRYGMKRDDFSPISKASFEETLTNFLNAGLLGLEDKINGISASILCGNMANIGTGCCDLKLK